MTMALPDDIRGIVTEIGAVYLKKARGTLTAQARVTVPEVGADPIEIRVETVITDASPATLDPAPASGFSVRPSTSGTSTMAGHDSMRPGSPGADPTAFSAAGNVVCRVHTVWRLARRQS